MKPEGVLTDPGSVPLFFCVLCKMERRDLSFTPPTQEHHTPVYLELMLLFFHMCVCVIVNVGGFVCVCVLD